MLEYGDQISTLRQLGASQRQIELTLLEQEAAFNRLWADAANNKLVPGMIKPDILAAYGEPVITQDVSGVNGKKERLLYRRPTAYFNSDKIYLYFNATGFLESAETDPMRQKI